MVTLTGLLIHVWCSVFIYRSTNVTSLLITFSVQYNGAVNGHHQSVSLRHQSEQQLPELTDLWVLYFACQQAEMLAAQRLMFQRQKTHSTVSRSALTRDTLCSPDILQFSLFSLFGSLLTPTCT